MNDVPKTSTTEPSDGPGQKLPYERPGVVSEEVFETLALSCNRGRGSCDPGSPDRS